MPPMRLIKCRRGIRWDPELFGVVRPIKHHAGLARGDGVHAPAVAARTISLSPGRLVSSNHLGRGATQLHVVVATWTVVAAVTPKEPCDQEHPEEHPHEPGRGQH